ncbi:MAG: hypothetical protein UT48_C0008G0007 [Parcubacteria group bacterium GW2011_GWE2_39_37]|uniref:ABC transporter permease protein n=1 Tax=Candidatus Falkowbacteria bacterium GW2011_GWF2_39_8 TaxID=1618642 RepID=A0A0G0PUQ5_9BACT|nr:MAG: hypothetical protein UT48_C0008G0007 [Parcubacteria group bacterium GW2011_GWE2_39_37]KKR31603.1 MAG: hypothetical protein UT64_C0055G0005 [Candidatus Falkowbacteria bacterium GW2011_GWF2_39_8]
MKKYWTVTKNSWQLQLQYRLNLVLWRLRSITILLVFYFLWLNLIKENSVFAGFSQSQIFTYFLLINLLRPIVFDGQQRRMAQEINDGSFSRYLIMPINHFLYEFSRQLSNKVINLFFAIVEVVIFILVLKPPLTIPSDPQIWLFFFLSLFLATILYYFLSYLFNLTAFWSREAMGPRFLFDWILEFSAGAYFPLSILMRSFFVFLSFLPFFYLIYFPITIYLSKTELIGIQQGIIMQLVFTIIIGFFVRWAYKKSLKKYTGEGI